MITPRPSFRWTIGSMVPRDETANFVHFSIASLTFTYICWLFSMFGLWHVSSVGSAHVHNVHIKLLHNRILHISCIGLKANCTYSEIRSSSSFVKSEGIVIGNNSRSIALN
jgi:hypothetical protein